MVGLGYFGSFHARQYAANPDAELVALADADLLRGSLAAKTYGCESYGDHRALIGKVEAVSVTAPTSLHHAIAKDFIEAGIPVFVEKPITALTIDAADLVARAGRAGVALQVGHIERFSPAFRALAEEVRAPRTIHCVRHAPWKERAIDVDVVLDLMIHDIDLVLSLAKAPIVSIEGTGAPVKTSESDVAGARLIFANGIVATLNASRVAAAPERSVSVTEEGRELRADLTGLTLTITDGPGTPEVRTLDRADNLAAEIADFIDAIRSGRPPIVDGKAGLEALKVADRIRAAIAAEQTRTGVMDG